MKIEKRKYFLAAMGKNGLLRQARKDLEATKRLHREIVFMARRGYNFSLT